MGTKPDKASRVVQVQYKKSSDKSKWILPIFDPVDYVYVDRPLTAKRGIWANRQRIKIGAVAKNRQIILNYGQYVAHDFSRWGHYNECNPNRRSNASTKADKGPFRLAVDIKRTKRQRCYGQAVDTGRQTRHVIGHTDQE